MQLGPFKCVPPSSPPIFSRPLQSFSCHTPSTKPISLSSPFQPFPHLILLIHPHILPRRQSLTSRQPYITAEMADNDEQVRILPFWFWSISLCSFLGRLVYWMDPVCNWTNSNRPAPEVMEYSPGSVHMECGSDAFQQKMLLSLGIDVNWNAARAHFRGGFRRCVRHLSHAVLRSPQERVCKHYMPMILNCDTLNNILDMS